MADYLIKSAILRLAPVVYCPCQPSRERPRAVLSRSDSARGIIDSLEPSIDGAAWLAPNCATIGGFCVLGGSVTTSTRKQTYVPPDDLLLPEQLPLLPPDRAPLAQAASAADRAAARALFADYRARRAQQTIRRQDADLACFAAYLAAAQAAPSGDLATDPLAWSAVSWGLVAGFLVWQGQQGYAIGSINVRLATVKSYAKLATQAGALAADAYALIALVPGYRVSEGRRVDAKRDMTRKAGAKKAEPTSITREQAALLKAQPEPRDALLMALLLDHGLRIGEVLLLRVKDFDRARGVLRFFRPKVDKVQQHHLSGAVLAALDAGALDGEDGAIFGSERTIRRRVLAFGEAIGLATLSPHDCRHAWATFATRAGTPIKALQDAGGWSSPAMPLRYAESEAIANTGVRLD